MAPIEREAVKTGSSRASQPVFAVAKSRDPASPLIRLGVFERKKKKKKKKKAIKLGGKSVKG